MGNQLVAIAPSQIFPVEHYMSDIDIIGDLVYESNLGSTRFFKVALARHQRRKFLVVVKVFTIQDLSLTLLRNHRDRLIEIKRILDGGGAVNCLPFQKAFLTERAGFIVRQYVKYSLYDRISTRPFLKMIEKRWLAFQLLLAVQQAHRHGIVHGDIKLENILVTSWNWLLLADFASFKPAFLPEDNPADFSYFFDTSRRRTCYIAPERFKTRQFTTENSFLPEQHEELRGELLPSMDIFSAGCALIELFTEGVVPFTFSQLLAYRAGEYVPEKVLDKIEDYEVKSLLKRMIQRDPKLRHGANDYLSEEKGRVFPEYFYTFLQPYMQIFSTDPKMTSDQKILRIHNDIDNIIENVVDSDGLLLLSSLVTANVRSLKFSDAKLQSLEIITKLSKHLESEFVVDRIIPYIIYFLGDSYSAVRISAIHTLTKCVGEVTSVDLADANIFPDYILPSLLPLYNDPTVLVRAALAEVISQVAQESVRFLDLVMLSGSESDRPLPSYETELADLHNCVAEAVSHLLADSANLVKQTLMEHSVSKLAVFFGKLKANDVLLSHMITFLNDKEDAQLRRSFYENVVGVATYVGWQCSPILLPLLQQGLSDPEEFVIYECIGAMSSLTELGLLQKVALYELLEETTSYLLHPNLWIRQATAGFVSSACSVLDAVDVQVKIGTMLEPFLRTRVVQLALPFLILSNLESSIPRSVFDDIIRNPSGIENFLQMLEERRNSRAAVSRTNHLITYSDMDSKTKLFFKRLASEGMIPSVEDKLLYCKENLIKISRNKSLLSSRQNQNKEVNGDLNLADYQFPIYKAALDTEVQELPPPAVGPADVLYTSTLLNEEWQHMFGPEALPQIPQPSQQLSSSCLAPETALEAIEQQQLQQQQQQQQKKDICDPKGGPTFEQAPCKVELDNLISKKRGEFAIAVRKKLSIENRRVEGRISPSSPWKPRGILIAHLHEHEAGITKLVRLPEKPIFASASADGCVRLWDCAKMEGSNISNKAHRKYRMHDGSPITCLSVCSYSDLMVSGAENGTISVFRTEGAIVDGRTVDLESDGPPIALYFCETGASPLLVYGTAFGSIIGWDLRAPKNAFHLENELRNGLQTAFAISTDQSWAVSGTSSGILSAWDLRFSLQIVNRVHPAEARIRDILIHPTIPATVIASVQGNNEVGIWDIESQCRSTVLWASPNPVLSSQQQQQHHQMSSVCAMFSASSRHSNALITGGTDKILRFWNLNSPGESFIISGPSNSTTSNDNLVSYKSKLVDGTEVIQEFRKNTSAPTAPSSSSSSALTTGSATAARAASVAAAVSSVSEKPVGLEDPAVGHHDWISSVTMVMASRWYVVSGSRDGVIKLWK